MMLPPGYVTFHLQSDGVIVNRSLPIVVLLCEYIFPGLDSPACSPPFSPPSSPPSSPPLPPPPLFSILYLFPKIHYYALYFGFPAFCDLILNELYRKSRPVCTVYHIVIVYSNIHRLGIRVGRIAILV